jgi:hypothetical protein
VGIRTSPTCSVCSPRNPTCVSSPCGTTIRRAIPPAITAATVSRALAREIARSRTPAVAALFVRELPALHRLGGVLRERLLGRGGGRHSGAIAP